jgi:SPP1 family phage portal protein
MYDLMNNRLQSIFDVEPGTAPDVGRIEKGLGLLLTQGRQVKQWHDYYTGYTHPVHEYTLPDTLKIDNRIGHNFFRQIVEGKCGYLYGNPQNVFFPDGDGADVSATDNLTFWRNRHDLSKMDYQTGVYVDACGYAMRMMYMEDTGDTRSPYLPSADVEPAVQNIEPWTCALIGDFTEPAQALRYWEEYEYVNGELQKIRRIRFYDAQMWHDYKQAIGTHSDVEHADRPQYIESVVHGFTSCPFIGYANNAEMLPSFYNVIDKVKDYSKQVSNMSSELEQLRHGYLVFQDIHFESPEKFKEMADLFRQTGSMKLHSVVDKNGSVYFLQKNINDTAHENHLNRLKQDIFQDSQHIDLSDEQFGGNLSGVAIEYKLTPLENKSEVSEEHHRASDRVMYKKLFAEWRRFNSQLAYSYLDIEMVWTRNLPENIPDQLDSVFKARQAGLPNEVAASLAPGIISDIKAVSEEMDARDARSEFIL